MPKFRRKPSKEIIEAEQFIANDQHPRLVKGMKFWPDESGFQPRDMSWGYVTTIHGQRAHVHSGDWILPEPDGEHFYPVKPDIFADRYEMIESEELPPDSTAQVFDYTKETRFGVIKKLPRREQFQCNFRYLHPTREAAEKEALRLTAKYKTKFYIVEIQRITGGIEATEAA